MEKTIHIGHKLKPITFNRQDELILFVTKTVLSSSFPKWQCAFAVCAPDAIDPYCSDLVICRGRNRDVLFELELKVALHRLSRSNPLFFDMSHRGLIDCFSEFANQFLGVLNHNFLTLLKSGFRINLPTHYHVSSYSTSINDPLIPGISIMDQDKSLLITLGLTSLIDPDPVHIDFGDKVFCYTEEGGLI